MRDHLGQSSKKKTHLGYWIASVLSRELKPSLIELRSVPTYGADDAERKYIDLARRLGMNLVNATDGGEGGLGRKPSEETRKKMSEAGVGEKNPFFGKKHSPETRQKISEAKKGHGLGKTLSPEHIEKIRGAKLGQPRSKETCEKISKALSGRKLSAAHVAAVTSALPRGSQHPAFGVPVSEEKRAAISAKLTGLRDSEETKANKRVAQQLRRSKEKESRG